MTPDIVNRLLILKNGLGNGDEGTIQDAADEIDSLRLNVERLCKELDETRQELKEHKASVHYLLVENKSLLDKMSG